jgi:hypothetical protein
MVDKDFAWRWLGSSYMLGHTMPDVPVLTLEGTELILRVLDRMEHQLLKTPERQIARRSGDADDITILYYGIGGLPVRRSVRSRLAEFQELVVGAIEIVGLRDDIYLICNEKDVRQRISRNRVGPSGDVIMGAFFVTAITKSFHRSLTEEEISWVLSVLRWAGCGPSLVC